MDSKSKILQRNYFLERFDQFLTLKIFEMFEKIVHNLGKFDDFVKKNAYFH